MVIINLIKPRIFRTLKTGQFEMTYLEFENMILSNEELHSTPRFQIRYILNPWCMLFQPARVLLKVISILFKVKKYFLELLTTLWGKIIHSTNEWMETAWISESGGTKVSRLGTWMTRYEQSWHTDLLLLFWTILPTFGS